MPKIQLRCASCVKIQHSFHGCVGRGVVGVVLERDIDLHMDAEGEIVRKQVRGET